MTTPTTWSRWEIETVQLICDAGEAGLDLLKLRDAAPAHAGWTAFNDALTALANKLARASLVLTFSEGRAQIGPSGRTQPNPTRQIIEKDIQDG